MKRTRALAAMGAMILGAALTAAMPVTARASTAQPAASTVSSSVSSSFQAYAGDIRALGHTWNLEISVETGGTCNCGGNVAVNFWTTGKDETENYLWSSPQAFASTAARELVITRAEHVTFKTGHTLSPVLTTSLTFTPLKSHRNSCASGSSVDYTGHVTGTATLATGLRGVRTSVSFSKWSDDDSLNISKSCVPPPVRYPSCGGGASWNIASVSGYDNVGSAETPGANPPWDEIFFWGGTGVRTASKWLTWTGDVDVLNDSVPKLNTKARTVTVALTGSSALTGSAVINYTFVEPGTPIPCYVGHKPYSETTTLYFGSAKATKPLQAHTVLDGTVTVAPIRDAGYFSSRLKAR